MSVNFLRNYNSPKYRKDVFLNLKDFKNDLEISHEEWNLILDLADNNYLNVWAYLSFNYGRGKEKKKFSIPPREK